MFDPEIHSVSWPYVPSGKWRVSGVDYGTTNPSVFIAMTMMTDRYCAENGLPMGTMILHDEWRWDSRLKRQQLTMKPSTPPRSSKWKRMLGARRDDHAARRSRSRRCRPERQRVHPPALARRRASACAPETTTSIAGIMETASLLESGTTPLPRPDDAQRDGGVRRHTLGTTTLL
jgi:hypothetical protein